MNWFPLSSKFLNWSKDAHAGDSKTLSPETAFTIIWYLQEHLSIFPDQIEKCSICGELYDSYIEGYHSEKRDLFMCSSCDDGIDDDDVEDIHSQIEAMLTERLGEMGIPAENPAGGDCSTRRGDPIYEQANRRAIQAACGRLWRMP